MSCSLQLWTGKHGKFLASCANFFEQKWTSEMDSADQNTSKTALKRKLYGYGQILVLKFIYIESIHPFYQAQCTVHRWIPIIQCIFQLRTDKIECMAVWETKPCCFCLRPATSDAGNLGQNFTSTDQFLANLKLESDSGCKKESIAHFSNILPILYRPQWWAWLSPMLICHPFLTLPIEPDCTTMTAMQCDLPCNPCDLVQPMLTSTHTQHYYRHLIVLVIGFRHNT